MFAEKFTEILEKYSIRNRKLSFLTGITEGFLSDIKRGRSLPRKEKLMLILDNLPLTIQERDELYNEWERDSSPETFVEKFDALKTDYNLLIAATGGEEKARTSIEVQRLNNKYVEKLEQEKEKYKLYYDLFMLLPEEDRKFMIKQILSNIEYDLRETRKYEENKLEIEKLKMALRKGIKYDF